MSDPIMTDAFARLLRCLRDPMDVRVLAPNIVREITYRLLQGPYGTAVREIGIVDSQTQRIGKVIELLKRDYAKPLHTMQLARVAGMSASSFHHHFKRVTNHSPLQYQKQLRLQEARRLLFGDASATDVGFQVGYESSSQFSREYARLFGLPPGRDARRLTAAPESASPRRAGR
jgi:transcriptional regulator GlxA family with amidase domain